MSKFVQILFVVFLFVALCSAEAPRSRTSRNRFLARQEAADSAADAAVTPYPSAKELKPEVPFDETVAQEKQPDEVYGPPEDEAASETVSVTAAEEDKATAEEETAVAEEEEQTVTEVESSPARLTARRVASARKSSVKPAKLRKAVPARLQLKPKYIPQPSFYRDSQ